jgi:hypothetical protein
MTCQNEMSYSQVPSMVVWHVLRRAHDSYDKVDDSDSEQSLAVAELALGESSKSLVFVVVLVLVLVLVAFVLRMIHVSRADPSSGAPLDSFHPKEPKQPMTRTSLTRTRNVEVGLHLSVRHLKPSYSFSLLPRLLLPHTVYFQH